MAKQHIMERAAEQIGLDFYALRKDGVAMLQDLCSARWTDYNLHDPGVTTLEQLCYALTDLAYRTDFGVPDYLTAPDGTIDYAGQALYAPQDALSSQALTANDYRKLIFDTVLRVAEVWVRAAAPEHGGKGLMSIFVMPAQDNASAHDAALLLLGVKALYAANRCLCEDVAEIRLVQTAPFLLKGAVEIEHGREPAEILAQVMADCADFVSSGMSTMRFQHALAQGKPLDQLFEGPATQHGWIGTRDTGASRTAFDASELIAVIQAVPGVRRVRNLSFVYPAGHESTELKADPASGSYPRLQFPRDSKDIPLLQLVPPQGIVFGVSEQMLPIGRVWREKTRALYADAELMFKKRAFERMAFRSSDTDGLARSLELPRGRFREFSAYYSIQHQFPAIYGINDAGVPSSASEQRKVEAKQLKAYLFPFEQLMANYLQNLQELPRLFSPAIGQPRQSYFAQHLGPRTIAGIDALYQAGTLPQTTGQLPAGHDDYFERKGRVLDYLLSLYGEEFPQATLRRFNHYHRGATEEWLLTAKATLLSELVDLGGRRGTAFDYLKGSENAPNVPRLQRRAGILLGLYQPELEGSFSAVLARHRLSLVDDSGFDKGAHPDHAYEEDEEDGLVKPAPPDPDDPVQPAADLAFPFPQISQTFLRHGCSLHNYRLAAKDGGTVLYFKTGEHQRALDAFADRHSAQAAAHRYVATLARINFESEGMHIVEHLLLRPRGATRYRIDNFGDGEHFFTCRISVVLSGWTLRSQDPEFRNFAEDTISQHCPAHIYPAFHWLGPDDMRRFEADHSRWRESLRAFERLRDIEGSGADAHRDQLDADAEPLAHFLYTRIGGKK